jgi:hypothetical protein
MAAWPVEFWDRFPHLAVTSSVRRCGKTRLLQIIEMLCPRPYNTPNISPAAIYRIIEEYHPTLLLDEAQSISRRGSESSEIVRELLNAGIDRESKVFRVGGKKNNEIYEFSAYCPKVIALIGDLDGVLSDRCLPVTMKRKTAEDSVLPYRSRLVKPIGLELKEKIEQWAEKNGQKIGKIYDGIDVFPIENDRLAELLLSLQAVITFDDEEELKLLGKYAESLDERSAETECPGVRLLGSIKKIFDKRKKVNRTCFLPTAQLIAYLAQNPEEPWARWSRGETITPEALANLLRPFDIRSERNKVQTMRGFFSHRFEEAWKRYLTDTP